MFSRIVLSLCLGLPVAASFFLPLPDDHGSIGPFDLSRVPCCAFRHVTGFPCPFCGLTRSFISLAHGRVGDSLKYHLLGPALFAGFIAGAILAPLTARTARDRGAAVAPPSPAVRAAQAAACAFLAAWCVKLAAMPRCYW